MKNKYLITAATLLALPMGSAMADAKFDKMMKDSFQTNGIASIDRLKQDAAQKYCSDPAVLAGKGNPKQAEAIGRPVSALPKAVVAQLGAIKPMLRMAVVAITAIKLIKQNFLMETLAQAFGTMASCEVTAKKW